MDGRPSHKSATPTVFSKETNPGRSASNMGTSDEPSQRIPSPTDPTAGLILIQGHYIIHLAMFIAIFFVQKPPKILNCLMNNELASQINNLMDDQTKAITRIEIFIDKIYEEPYFDTYEVDVRDNLRL